MKHDDLDVGAMGYKIPWSTKKHLANMGERIHMQGSTCRRMQGNDLDNPTRDVHSTIKQYRKIGKHQWAKKKKPQVERILSRLAR